MSFELNRKDLEPLLLGGGFFGSGGGGTIESARHLVSKFQVGDYYSTDKVRVVSVAEAIDGEAVMVAYMGAPDAINTVMYPDGPVRAALQVQQRLASEGRKLAYVVSPESGALGFTVACLVAAKLGLTVIDADGAGRAVPSLPMLTYAQAEISPRPAFLVSQSGLCVELDVTPRDGAEGGAGHQQDVSEIAEQMMRPIVADPSFGQYGGLAMWVMTTKQIPEALPITGTLSRALTVGRALQNGEINSSTAMIAFLQKSYGITAYAITQPGVIQSVNVDTTGGFDLGKVSIKSGKHLYTVLYQNESLLAWDSEKPYPIVVAPDSLAYFAEGDGQSVFSNGDLTLADGSLNPVLKDRVVTVLAWQAAPELREPDGLILQSFLTELQVLGYLGPYVPVQNLQDFRGVANV